MSIFKLLLTCLVFSLPVYAGFVFEDIKIPADVDPQVGGLTVTPNGTLAACFHRGELMLYNPKTKEWRLFAEGLQEPLGIVALSDSEFVVMQRPELTLIRDKDGGFILYMVDDNRIVNLEGGSRLNITGGDITDLATNQMQLGVAGKRPMTLRDGTVVFKPEYTITCANDEGVDVPLSELVDNNPREFTSLVEKLFKAYL